MQIRAEIRQSVADVDSDLLLSQYWPPITFVRHGNWSESDFATMDYKAPIRTQKHRRTHTESENPRFSEKFGHL